MLRCVLPPSEGSFLTLDAVCDTRSKVLFVRKGVGVSAVNPEVSSWGCLFWAGLFLGACFSSLFPFR